MNTKTELQWLIEFGQKDLNRIRRNTREKLTNELQKKIESLCSFWGAVPIDSSGILTYQDGYLEPDREMREILNDAARQEYLLLYQRGAEDFVRDLIGTLKKERGESFDRLRTPNLVSIMVKFWSSISKTTDGVFNPEISVESEPDQLIYFFMNMLLRGTKIEDFKNCAYCNKLFLQVSREKKFCTRNCAANFAKG